MPADKNHLPPLTLNERELVFALVPDFEPSISRSRLNDFTEPRWSYSVTPVFEEEKDKRRVRSERKREDLARERARYHTLEAPDQILDQLVKELLSRPEVAAAYVKPGIRLPDFSTEPEGPGSVDVLNGYRAYAGAAPGGIEALWAHTQAGGDGQDVHIVDLEWNWDFDHEDLRVIPPRHDVLYGTAFNGTHHGTAILGMLAALDNGIGITGICPAAKADTAVFEKKALTSLTIAAVAAKLGAGDIMLIPYERPGPRYNYDAGNRKGGIPLEWWDDDRLAIETAVNHDIIVVSAAGNGWENLDDGLYDIPGLPENRFPATWINPFRRSPDPGSILVGAGAPPPGTHDIDWGPDRSRIEESNYGSVVDAQGWGHEVTTLGYGNVIRPVPNPTKHQYYTRRFGMTSAASAMVAGALACAQGARRRSGKPLFDSLEARKALHKTGSPQQWPGAPGTDRIGNRPNLRELLALA